MEEQEEQPVNPIQFLLESFNGLRADVDNKIDGLAKEVRVISDWVTAAKAVEGSRDLAAEIRDLNKAVAAQRELNAEYRGQIKMLRIISSVIGFVATVLVILEAVRLIPGK